MNIYFVSQKENYDYDTYDSFVIIADNEEEARYTHPANPIKEWDGIKSRYDSWCDAEDVTVEYVGKAGEWYIQKTIICASYNAG